MTKEKCKNYLEYFEQYKDTIYTFTDFGFDIESSIIQKLFKFEDILEDLIVEGLHGDKKALLEDFDYYLYDLPTSPDGPHIIIDDKEYTIKSVDDFLNFLEDQYKGVFDEQ